MPVVELGASLGFLQVGDLHPKRIESVERMRSRSQELSSAHYHFSEAMVFFLLRIEEAGVHVVLRQPANT